MALAIYGEAQSRTSRIQWLAKELGPQFERATISQRDAETRNLESPNNSQAGLLSHPRRSQ